LYTSGKFVEKRINFLISVKIGLRGDLFMKRNTFLFLLLFIILILVILITFYNIINQNRKIEQMNVIENGYIVKLFNGHLAVFDSDDSNHPIKVTEIGQESLRQYDRELLSKGIFADDYTSVLELIEDFGS